MKFTIFGGQGFVGSGLVRYLTAQGFEVNIPSKDFVPQGEYLGRVIYSVGVTGDFKTRVLDTMRAHVGLTVDILEKTTFDSFVYLSSTRVYGTGNTFEDTDICANPLQKDHLYNLSKLAGESVCLSLEKKGVRVARLSNVYGDDLEAPNFLSSIMLAARLGRIAVRSSPQSAKDYVALEDVVRLLTLIAIDGGDGVYNVASGENVTNEEIVNQLREISGCDVHYDEGAPTSVNTPISIERIKKEFEFQPVRLLDVLPALMK